MAATHDWECFAHGHFEARGTAAKPPKCPRGCSPKFVKLVFLQPVGHVSERTRKGDKLVKEMATTQRLGDLITSPSRSGGSVAERNRLKNGGRAQVPLTAEARSAKFGEYMGALTNKENALTRVGLGNPYNASEWTKRRDGDGKAVGPLTHTGRQGPISPRPAAEVERVKE